MKKVLSLAFSASLALSILLLPSANIYAADETSPSFSVNDNSYQKMKDAGMSDDDIELLRKHNENDLRIIKSGELEEKALNDQKTSQSLTDSSENPRLAASSLGTVGDILVAYNASSWGIDFGYPGHAAIVSLLSGKTVESFPADGVQYHTNDWRGRSNVYGMSVKGASGSQYRAAAQYAANQIGKPYNWNFVNPWTEAKFYCSQLVWKAWKTQGIDVDYITIDPIVTPMEIAKSGNTSIYYSN
ncbi:YiiX/YebB-like N1pC/P60 family cysteine hydrolase [Paenibacillus sp. BT-177]|uniref:YiiX/YebB-like N1pC/P60 family cysteine hydrolase n=1 Tax=Paenibacillus sp. BT-177 TaxID=2986930 RepID=UPI0021F6F914|nr:YiiX/YebB-like N1pC/P60 family cysteine hydrolase [Paenibacillus sp. BT-177]